MSVCSSLGGAEGPTRGSAGEAAEVEAARATAEDEAVALLLLGQRLDGATEGEPGRSPSPPAVSSEGGGAVSEREARKLRKKEVKAARRAKREGGLLKLKPCDVCGRDVDLLVRCQTDETLQWRMVCGRCWRDVSGGVVDGDASHPHYRYGGLWKAK